MKTVAEYLEMAKTTKANYDKTVGEAARKVVQLTADLAKAKSTASQALASGDKAAYTSAMQDVDFIEKRLSVEKEKKVKPVYTAEEHNAIVRECSKAAGRECVPHYQKIVELIKQYNAELDAIKGICDKHNACADVLRRCGVPTGLLGRYYQHPFRSVDSVVSGLVDFDKGAHVIYQIKNFHIPKKPTNQK